VQPFVTYLVTGRDPHGDFNIRRRYREFLLLRNKLVERFIGMYIPPIPSKRAAVSPTPSRATQRSEK
jgi:sorting nexin-1/2